jgi:hypothetical protein
MAMGTVSAAVYTRFAGESLDRWRQLIQAEVVHRDPRWGTGRVVDVQWQAKDDGLVPRGSIFLRVVYANGLKARLNTRSLDEYLETVEVPRGLADLLADCFPSAGTAERSDCAQRLEAFDKEIRTKLDAERLRRADDLSRRAKARRSSDDPEAKHG